MLVFSDIFHRISTLDLHIFNIVCVCANNVVVTVHHKIDDDCSVRTILVRREMADKSNPSTANTSIDMTDIGCHSTWIRRNCFLATLSNV